MRIEVLDPPLESGTRPPGTAITTIVVHASAGRTLEGALAALRARGLSYGYLIAPDGRIVKGCPVGRRAYHAGASVGPDGPDVNRYSVGVCLIHPNDGRAPYAEEQLAALVELMRGLKRAVPTIRFATTHRQISWPRKTDPRGLDVTSLAERAGLPFWRRAGVPE